MGLKIESEDLIWTLSPMLAGGVCEDNFFIK